MAMADGKGAWWGDILVVVGVSKTTFPILTTIFPFSVLSAHHATANEAAGKHRIHIPSHR
jgi:hypothetical protein